jgi:hypothetical protein
MSQKTETLSYNLDSFMRYKEKNTNLTQDLSLYCYNNRDFNSPNLHQYNDVMGMIVDMISKGIDTNDVIFKNDVKYIVNTINKKNYNDAIKKLESLNFSTRENVQFLAYEFVVCAMRCPIAIKGVHKDKTRKGKAVSEIIADAIKYFCVHLRNEEKGIYFHDELLKICRKFFMEFVNLTQSMDQNNENTSDNYKGFMTTLGLMYENNLLPNKIIFECIDSIKRTIYCSKINISTEKISSKLTKLHEKMFGVDKKYDDNLNLFDHIIYFDTDDEILNGIENRFSCYRNSTECSNFYKGYENLSNHFVSSLKSKNNECIRNLENIKNILKNLEKNNDVDKYYEENELENNEENRNFLMQKYNSQLDLTMKNVEKFIGILNQYIESHDQFENLNNIYQIKNKDQLSQPLKQHMMIIHSEISQELKSILKNFSDM